MILTENGKRLLALKGVSLEELAENEPKPKIDSAQILKMYREKKVAEQNPEKWDDLDTVWNPDGTLSRLVTYKNGEVFWEMDFAWNPDGTLNKIMRVNGR